MVTARKPLTMPSNTKFLNAILRHLGFLPLAGESLARSCSREGNVVEKNLEDNFQRGSINGKVSLRSTLLDTLKYSVAGSRVSYSYK